MMYVEIAVGYSTNDKLFCYLVNMIYTCTSPSVLVDTNDVAKAERWLKSWARVKIKRGDRTLLDVARSMKRDEIVSLLEQYQHFNEFVCATFACLPDTMMDILALGKGEIFIMVHLN